MFTAPVKGGHNRPGCLSTSNCKGSYTCILLALFLMPSLAWVGVGVVHAESVNFFQESGVEGFNLPVSRSEGPLECLLFSYSFVYERMGCFGHEMALLFFPKKTKTKCRYL